MALILSEWDRPEQRRYAFPRQQILCGMIRRNIKIPYFTQAHRYLPAVMEVYAFGRCMMEGWETTCYARVLAACELAGVCLPDDCFAQENVARKTFIRACLRYLCSKGSWANSYSTGNEGQAFRSAVQAINAILTRVPVQAPPDDVDSLIRTMMTIQPDDPIQDNHYTEDLAQAVAILVDFLVSRSTARARSAGANQYAAAYVGIGKRGTITPEKLAYINQTIALETDLEINVTEEQVRTTRRALCNYITENNARDVMGALSTSMTAYSLRLKLTVDQSLRAGMTQYWAILSALTYFPTFNWAEASRYIPDDFTRFNIAVGTVGNNVYYGFAHNIGVAAHTQYKSLGWLAVKLLVKFKGAEFGSLANYRAVTRNPERQHELQQLIDNYEPPAAGAALANLDAILMAGRNVLANMQGQNR